MLQNDFMNSWGETDMRRPRGSDIYPEKIANIKARAFVKQEQARVDTEKAIDAIKIAEHLEYYEKRYQESEKSIQKLLEVSDKKHKRLRAMEKKYGEIEECPSLCKEGRGGRDQRYGSSECRTCDGVGFITPDYKSSFYMSIDVAAEDSEDSTCIGTFKKSSDGLIELVDMKIIKPKKKVK